MTIEGFAFDPAALTVPLGSTVVWTNRDDASHTVTFDDGSAESPTLLRQATYSRTLSAAGIYQYHCAIHPSMEGLITVEP